MANKQAKNNNLVDKPNNKGRPKGSVNKTTALLKDAILQAAEQAGDKEGMVGYLKQQAELNPGPFMALLGKVLPMQIANADGESFKTENKFIFVAVGSDEPDKN